MSIKKLLLGALILTLLTVGWLLRPWNDKPALPTSKQSIRQSQPNNTVQFNKKLLSISDPSSFWVIVNKQHPLVPVSYRPRDLVVPAVPLRVPGNESMQIRKATAEALQTMFAAAHNDGVNLMLSSGYRSYDYQMALYNGYVKSQGQVAADTQSARPGYSEHQTGLALDVEPTSRQCEVEQCFVNIAEGKWVAANGYKFGFIVRYAADKVAISGYEYEPWHIRYIGIPLATEMHNRHIETLEEFFNVSGGVNY